jgi:hypothetical protein
MNSLLCNTGLYSDVLNTPASYVLILLAVVNYAIVLAVVVRHRFQRKKASAVVNGNNGPPQTNVRGGNGIERRPKNNIKKNPKN